MLSGLYDVCDHLGKGWRLIRKETGEDEMMQVVQWNGECGKHS